MTEPNHNQHDEGLTRRQVLHGALAGGAMLSASGLLAACGSSSTKSSAAAGGSAPTVGKIKPGGALRVGATGGGAKDSIDAHLPTADPDIMRVWNLYEPIAVRPADFGPLEMLVAESLEAEHNKADSWVVKVRPGVEFHNGKTVGAAGHRLLAAADPRSEEPQGRRSVDRLHRHQERQGARQVDGADPAQVRQLGVPRRHRPVLQRRSSRSAMTRPSRSAPGRSCTRASPPASRACSRGSPTTGRAASRTSTR